MLGASGMLGSNIATYLTEQGHQVLGTYSKSRFVNTASVDMCKLAALEDVKALIKENSPDFVINCIVAKNRYGSVSLRDLLLINSFFPRTLSSYSQQLGFSLVQISSDAVFFGKRGNYLESDLPVPSTFYGLSKLLGESKNSNVVNLRMSTIGVNRICVSTSPSLIERFIGLPKNSKVKASREISWNGITCDALAELINSHICETIPLSGTQHIFSNKPISKYNLYMLIRDKFGRQDIQISSQNEPHQKKLTLSTLSPEIHERLWCSTSRDGVPTIQDQIDTMVI